MDRHGNVCVAVRDLGADIHVVALFHTGHTRCADVLRERDLHRGRRRHILNGKRAGVFVFADVCPAFESINHVLSTKRHEPSFRMIDMQKVSVYIIHF